MQIWTFMYFCFMESVIKNRNKKKRRQTKGKNLTQRNRVARQKDGKANRFLKRTNKKYYWSDKIAKPAICAHEHVCDISQKLGRPAAFPALGRENVITDLINWTYGRRRTKWLALQPLSSPPPSSFTCMGRPSHAELPPEWTLFGDDNNGSVSIMSAGIVARICVRSLAAFASNSIVSSRPTEKIRLLQPFI